MDVILRLKNWKKINVFVWMANLFLNASVLLVFGRYEGAHGIILKLEDQSVPPAATQAATGPPPGEGWDICMYDPVNEVLY